jgi:dihydrofolate synthase/folylpolyglutamate synthase
MAVLGTTVAQIAAEKAGIIKPGIPTVSAPQVPEALTVIEATCQAQGAPLTLVGRDWTWKSVRSDLVGQEFDLYRPGESLEHLRIPLLGAYQLANAATAVAVVTLLRDAGCQVSETAIRAGLSRVQWPGRLEILASGPWLVVDCAHNGDSAAKLIEAVRTLFPFRRLFVILGASSDHVTAELLDALLSGASVAIATESRHPRAADAAWLQSRAAQRGLSMVVSANVPDALEMALALAGVEDLVLCTGSVFVAAEARAAYMSRIGLPSPATDPF